MRSVPLIFGVTGHRDLRKQDVPKLEERVRRLLEDYRQKYPHTELIVVSALAEGADMLVARVAKELGVVLHVLIPYQEPQYMKSFDDPANVETFRELKAYASRFEVNSCVDTYGHESCYQQLGEKIADISTILIALWDGTDTGKRGGTSAIVRYQREGLNENRFDAMDGNALCIITTPRISNPDVKTDFSVKFECLGKFVKGEAFEEMLAKIDALNAKNADCPFAEESYLKSHMNIYEDRAKKNQTAFKNYSKAILILTALAIASLEIMHAMRLDHFIVGYGVGLLLAFVIYALFMKNGKVQDDFVHSRGMAEAIRVQNAWNAANLDKNAAAYYLKDQHHKFTWIKTALKNMFYVDRKPFTPNYNDNSSVEDWIDKQIVYFEGALDDREHRYKKWERLEHLFYKAGFVTLLVMFAIYILEATHVVHHGALWLNWHYLVLVSGLLLLIAAFIGEKYVKIEGYEDDIYHFNAMLGNFKDAQKALASTDNGGEAYKKIVYDLGIKALEENSKWVVLHDSMRAKPSLD